MSNTPPLTQDFNVHDVVTLIDYVDYTFTFRDEIEDLLPLLGVDKWRSNVTFEQKSVGHYREGVYTIGENIQILMGGPKNGFGKLTHKLEMKGQGCREFELLGGDYYKLFKFMREHGAVEKRIDGTIDTFTDKFFTLEKIKEYGEKRWYTSKSNKFFPKFISDVTVPGGYAEKTVYFGTEQSNTCTVFYDKNLERYVRGEISDIRSSCWYRVETRFRNKQATKFVLSFLECKGDMSFIPKMVYSFLDFKDPGDFKSRIENRRTVSWWTDFLGVSEKSKFFVDDGEIQSSIRDNKRYMETSISKMLARIYLADPKGFKAFIDSLIVARGYSLLPKDLVAINLYRQSKHLDVIDIEEMKDILSDLKGLDF